MPLRISTASNLAASVPHVDHYLSVGQQGAASDVHLGVNAQPLWRLHGNLEPIWPDAPKLSAEDTAALSAGFLNEAQRAQLEERGDVDFAYGKTSGVSAQASLGNVSGSISSSVSSAPEFVPWMSSACPRV